MNEAPPSPWTLPDELRCQERVTQPWMVDRFDLRCALERGHGGVHTYDMGEKDAAVARDQAQREADRAEAWASFVRSRPRVICEGQDVTEWVVSVLDALRGSMDAGSGFLDDSTTKAMEDLGHLLRFDEVVEHP